MKIAKKTASLFCVLALFVSMLTMNASADTALRRIGTGDASNTYGFSVNTSCKKESHYLKLKQTKGSAPYKTLATLIFEGEDAAKEARMYGKYTINVYDSVGQLVSSYTWKCDSSTKKIQLGQSNSTYYIEVVPAPVKEAFGAYIDKGILHWRILSYGIEAASYDGDWTTSPEWSVKTIHGAELVA